MSSASDSATWTMTSALFRPIRRRRSPGTNVWSLSAGTRAGRDARNAGTRPKTTPVSTDNVSVKSSTR